MTETAVNHNPARPDYVPYYEDEAQECDRLVRCLQQQIEDCFTTLNHIQDNPVSPPAWRDLRSGLRVWRAAIRSMTGARG